MFSFKYDTEMTARVNMNDP